LRPCSSNAHRRGECRDETRSLLIHFQSIQDSDQHCVHRPSLSKRSVERTKSRREESTNSLKNTNGLPFFACRAHTCDEKLAVIGGESGEKAPARRRRRQPGGQDSDASSPVPCPYQTGHEHGEELTRLTSGGAVSYEAGRHSRHHHCHPRPGYSSARPHPRPRSRGEEHQIAMKPVENV
jgi:hypothetical protein